MLFKDLRFDERNVIDIVLNLPTDNILSGKSKTNLKK